MVNGKILIFGDSFVGPFTLLKDKRYVITKFKGGTLKGIIKPTNPNHKRMQSVIDKYKNNIAGIIFFFGSVDVHFSYYYNNIKGKKQNNSLSSIKANLQAYKDMILDIQLKISKSVKITVINPFINPVNKTFKLVAAQLLNYRIITHNDLSNENLKIIASTSKKANEFFLKYSELMAKTFTKTNSNNNSNNNINYINFNKETINNITNPVKAVLKKAYKDIGITNIHLLYKPTLILFMNKILTPIYSIKYNAKQLNYFLKDEEEYIKSKEENIKKLLAKTSAEKIAMFSNQEGEIDYYTAEKKINDYYNKYLAHKEKTLKKQAKTLRKTKKKYITKGGAVSPGTQELEHKTLIWALDTPDKINKWNKILDCINPNPKLNSNSDTNTTIMSRLWGTRGMSIPLTGIDYAYVNLDKEKTTTRINPHVAVVVDKSINDIHDLYAETLNNNYFNDIDEFCPSAFKLLYAFVPYSVIDTSNVNYKLIMPMGLQKTPSGMNINYDIGVNKLSGQVKQGPKNIKDILTKLFDKIKSEFSNDGKNIAILTRFALMGTILSDKENTFLINKLLHKWSSIFPEHLKIGWKEYIYSPIELEKIKLSKNNIEKHKEDFKERKGKTDQYIDLISAETEYYNTKQEQQRNYNITFTSDEKSIAKTKFHYDPLEGGLSYNGIDDTLSLFSRDNNLLFTVPNVKDKMPIKRLLSSKFLSYIGLLLCGWTEENL
jgi:hypothetical protein